MPRINSTSELMSCLSVTSAPCGLVNNGVLMKAYGQLLMNGLLGRTHKHAYSYLICCCSGGLEGEMGRYAGKHEKSLILCQHCAYWASG